MNTTICLEPSMTIIMDKTQSFSYCMNLSLLFERLFAKTDAPNSLISNLTASIGLSYAKTSSIVPSIGIDYNIGHFETQAKFLAQISDKLNYYFSPQVGLNLKDNKIIFLLGYNLPFTKTSPDDDISGLTFTIGYRLTWKQNDKEIK